jgi:tRNA dimethylallyltransferase
MVAAPPLADSWFLSGPTAGGKTAVGLELAQRLNAEIVSLDSMALYQGLDVGTAKPTLEERRIVSHHLIDVIEPEQEFSLAQYLAAAEQSVADIRSRGRQALFVGGTPLYLKALLRGIFEGPPADWDLRRGWQRQAEAHGPQWLHEQLAAVDPAAAERLHPNDMRRLIRALEVYEKTGRPISEWQRQFDAARPADQCRVFVLDWPRETLYARIDARVDAMFAAGLVAEIEALLGRDVKLSLTARQALGYREVLEHLAGQRDLAETIELIKTRTRQFAKRQLTWFRSLSECRWLSVAEPLEAPGVAERILQAGAVNLATPPDALYNT